MFRGLVFVMRLRCVAALLGRLIGAFVLVAGFALMLAVTVVLGRSRA